RVEGGADRTQALDRERSGGARADCRRHAVGATTDRRGSRELRTLVIIPTYNERENIAPLLDQLLALPCAVDVLVVDDNSPDGTGSFVEERKRSEPRIHLIRRAGKMGLGSAYRDGFRYALDHGAEYIFEMDADFSHDPAAIPEFLRNAEEVDLV